MKNYRLMLAIAMMMIGAALPASAKVDMAILPGRDAVQLTIYNSADLTLVREQRSLTLQQGLNRLQFYQYIDLIFHHWFPARYVFNCV